MYDRLGSVAGLLNYTTGTLDERYEYDVFGKATVHTSAGNDGEWMTDDDVTSSTSSVGNPYMFTGRRYDSEIEKYYYRARYYDADTGRFLSPDPIGYYDSMNLYQYVTNNPLNWIDPWGLKGGGVGFSGSGGCGAGGTGGIMIVKDSEGNWGIYLHAGAGGYAGSSASITIDGMYFDGISDDLRGQFYTTGMSFGTNITPSIGGEYGSGKCNSYTGSVGYGVGVPVEMHGYSEYGEFLTWDYICDYWKDVFTTPIVFKGSGQTYHSYYDGPSACDFLFLE